MSNQIPNTRESVQSEEARLVYRYKDMDEVFDNLGEIILHHVMYQRPRLKTLNEYYEGRNVGIRERKARKNKDMSDVRISHPYARYISQFVQGYLTGVPVRMSAKDEEVSEVIKEVNYSNDVDDLNSEIMLDLSKYGRAYELVFHREDEGYKTIQLDVNNTFVIYDTSVSGDELCGVYYHLSEDGETVNVTVSSKDSIYVLEETELTEFEVFHKEEPKENTYGEVPIIEYTGDRSRQGDYELQLDLIDSYDSAVSNVTNFLTDFNESLLVFKGDTTDIEFRELTDKIGQGTVLDINTGMNGVGETRNVEVEYLTREYDFRGVESQLKTTREDVHKFSYIPNLNDEKFSGNSSGESMKYKKSGLNQLVKIKTRAMEKGLNKRYRMIINSIKDTMKLMDVEDTRVNYKWTLNIPKDDQIDIEIFEKLGGRLSQQTLIERYTSVSDVSEESDRLLAEDSGLSLDKVKSLSEEEKRGLRLGLLAKDTNGLEVEAKE